MLAIMIVYLLVSFSLTSILVQQLHQAMDQYEPVWCHLISKISMFLNIISTLILN